jgi:hypothetical protein
MWRSDLDDLRELMVLLRLDIEYAYDDGMVPGQSTGLTTLELIESDEMYTLTLTIRLNDND